MTPATALFNLSEFIGIDKTAEGEHRAIAEGNCCSAMRRLRGEPIAIPNLDTTP